MSTIKLRAALAALVCSATAIALCAGSAHALAPTTVAPLKTPPSLPQTAAAGRAAAWLAAQVNSDGYVSASGAPDLSDTVATVLALESTGTQPAVVERALTYLSAHVDAYVTDGGHDGPGELANLILADQASGANPTSFGGTDLVTRLLATIRTTGPDVGLFGAQSPTYSGAYNQGLALAALAAAGVTHATHLASAVTWLKDQQCATGGWEAFRAKVSKPCTKSSTTAYSGPDTNSTALAIEGLRAQKATLKHSPIAFFKSLEQRSGGWGYYGGAADPDSTALVIQAIVALHDSVSATTWRKGSNNPVSALLSFQLSSGALYYPGSPHTGNGLATEQAVPALKGKAFPF
jgi:hypothetical protein